jgi:hypothetical protein
MKLLALLVALSLPVALGGLINMEGNFKGPVILEGASGLLTSSSIRIKGFEAAEARIINGTITLGDSHITAEPQNAFITIGERALEGNITLKAETADNEVRFKGMLEIDGLRIEVGEISLETSGTVFSGTCKRIRFNSADALKIEMKNANAFSGIWKGGEYIKANGARIENGSIDIDVTDTPDATPFISVSVKLWAAALILMLFSAHVSMKVKRERDRRVWTISMVLAASVVLISLYLFDASFSERFGSSVLGGHTFEGVLTEAFSFSLLFLLLVLPVYYCARSLTRIFGLRKTALTIGIIVSFSALTYISARTDIMETLTLSLGNELVARLPFYSAFL